ncbi:unnamed protein product [Dicrocoelium dendriticum]|nr:unnamed protein product [Dicrocoelium dendriticum]
MKFGSFTAVILFKYGYSDDIWLPYISILLITVDDSCNYWDDELTQKAQQQSDTCRFGHNMNAGRVTSKWSKWVGQNIAGFQTYQSGFKAWFNGYKNYSFREKICRGGCLSYTQIVWAKTKAVGCGVTNCTGRPNFPYGMYLVCNYAPGGNYNNQSPYEAGNCVGR